MRRVFVFCIAVIMMLSVMPAANSYAAGVQCNLINPSWFSGSPVFFFDNAVTDSQYVSGQENNEEITKKFYINGISLYELKQSYDFTVWLYNTGENFLKIAIDPSNPNAYPFGTTEVLIFEVRNPISLDNGNSIQPFAKKYVTSTGIWSDYVREDASLTSISWFQESAILYMSETITYLDYEPVSSLPNLTDSIYINGESVSALNADAGNPAVFFEFYGGSNGNFIKITGNPSFDITKDFTIELRFPVSGTNGTIILPFAKKFISSTGLWIDYTMEETIISGQPIWFYGGVFTFDKPISKETYSQLDLTDRKFTDRIFINGQSITDIRDQNMNIRVDLYGASSQDIPNSLKIYSSNDEGDYQFDANGEYLFEVRSPIVCNTGNVIQTFAKKYVNGVWQDVYKEEITAQNFVWNTANNRVEIIFSENITNTGETNLQFDPLVSKTMFINGETLFDFLYEKGNVIVSLQDNKMFITPANISSILNNGQCTVELRDELWLATGDVIKPFSKKYIESTNTWTQPFTRGQQDMITAYVQCDSNHVPHMYINDIQTAPYFSFINGDMFENSGSLPVIKSTIEKASNNGIDLLQVHCNQSSFIKNEYGQYSFEDMDKVLSLSLTTNPNAKIILRMFIGDFMWSTERPNYPAGDEVEYKDGSKGGQISIASDMWYEEAQNYLREAIRYVLAVPAYRGSVIGYMMCAADSGEWFQLNIRELGLDYSLANTTKFQEWIQKKYNSDVNKLRSAWGDPNINFTDVEVPRDMPSDGSWLNGSPGTLFLSNSQQKFIDYGDYYSELTAKRIEGFCKIIKEETEFQSLSVAFYGYNTSMFDARSGHSATERLLHSPYVDMLAAPINYFFRNEGEHGSPQGFRDSVIRHGKIWMDEADYRSPIVTNPYADPDNPMPTIANKQNLLEIIKRQTATNLLTGSGNWYMDLLAKGWYDDNDVWHLVNQFASLEGTYDKSGNSAEVALIVDENAYALYQNAGSFNWTAMAATINAIHRAGVSFGIYSLQDVVEGRLNDTKLYIFLNPVRISDEKAKRLAYHIKKPGKTAVWMHSFGETSSDSVRLLTDMEIKQENSLNNSFIYLLSPYREEVGNGLTRLGNIEDVGIGLPNSSFTSNDVWSYVISSNVTSLGINTENKRTNFAITTNSGYQSIFYGNGMLQLPETVRYFAQLAGVNIFSYSNESLIASDNMIVIHSDRAGDHVIYLPQVTDVLDWTTGQRYNDVMSITMNLRAYETRVLFYGNNLPN